MNSAHGTAALPAVGFPIRISSDQSLVSGSPGLFAATHVLLRLLSPRHPSCALSSLVIVFFSGSPTPTKTKTQHNSLCLLAHMRLSKNAIAEVCLVEPIGI